MYNIASSLATREIIYVSTNVIKGRPQLNSHREDVGGRLYKRDGLDGFPAWELAGFRRFEDIVDCRTGSVSWRLS